LRIALDYIIRHLAYALVAEPRVKRLGIEVKRRDEQKHIGMFSKDALLSVAQKLRSDTLAAPGGQNADGLDVASKRSDQVQDDEARDLIRGKRDIRLASRVGDDLAGLVIRIAQRQPGLGTDHGVGAKFGFAFALHPADHDGHTT